MYERLVSRRILAQVGNLPGLHVSNNPYYDEVSMNSHCGFEYDPKKYSV